MYVKAPIRLVCREIEGKKFQYFRISRFRSEASWSAEVAKDEPKKHKERRDSAKWMGLNSRV